MSPIFKNINKMKVEVYIMKVFELKSELNFKGRTHIIDFQTNKVVSTSRDFVSGKNQTHDFDKVVFYRFIPFYNVYGQIVDMCCTLNVYIIQTYFDRKLWRWVNCD